MKSVPLLLVVGHCSRLSTRDCFRDLAPITAEIYPTAMRAEGFTLNVSRLGSAAAPFYRRFVR
jgi:hypothetical protein